MDLLRMMGGVSSIPYTRKPYLYLLLFTSRAGSMPLHIPASYISREHARERASGWLVVPFFRGSESSRLSYLLQGSRSSCELFPSPVASCEACERTIRQCCSPLESPPAPLYCPRWELLMWSQTQENWRLLCRKKRGLRRNR